MQFNRWLFLIFLCLLSVSYGHSIASAKDCDCQQHKAGASGSGTCTLTEDQDRCSITYTATSGSERTSSYVKSRTEKERVSAERFLENIGKTIPLEETFLILNARQPETISIDEFRALAINAFALAGARGPLLQWIKKMRLDGAWVHYHNDFERLYRDFQKKGCVEFTEAGTRFLLISHFSKYNGTCGD